MASVKLNVNEKQLAWAIREFRLKRSLSQEHLADMANVSLRTIQRLERNGKCSHETLLALADVFDVEVGELTRMKYSINSTAMDNTNANRTLKMAGIAYLVLLVLCTSGLALFFYDHYTDINRNMVANDDPYVWLIRAVGGFLAVALSLFSVYVGIKRRWYEGLATLTAGFILSGLCFSLLPWIYFPEDQYSAAAVWVFQWMPVMVLIWFIANIFHLFISQKKSSSPA